MEAMIRMINEREAVGGLKIGRGTQSTYRNRIPLPLHPLQVLHDFTRDRIWATTVLWILVNIVMNFWVPWLV
jgi:hypothetical protein